MVDVPVEKKKRVNKSKPVQRSLRHLEENGWLVASVEKYVKHDTMAFGRRIDVWGFGDLLACRPTMVEPCSLCENGKYKGSDCPRCNGSGKFRVANPSIALVQCCPDSRMAEHRAKLTGGTWGDWTEEEKDEAKKIHERLKAWKAAGGRVFLMGWGLRGPRGEKKRWTLREEEL